MRPEPCVQRGCVGVRAFKGKDISVHQKKAGRVNVAICLDPAGCIAIKVHQNAPVTPRVRGKQAGVKPRAH